MKKLLLFPCLLLALGLSSCESSDDEVMSIELVSPKKLAVTTELATDLSNGMPSQKRKAMPMLWTTPPNTRPSTQRPQP